MTGINPSNVMTPKDYLISFRQRIHDAPLETLREIRLNLERRLAFDASYHKEFSEFTKDAIKIVDNSIHARFIRDVIELVEHAEENLDATDNS